MPRNHRSPKPLNFHLNTWTSWLEVAEELKRSRCRICNRNLTESEISASNPHLCRKCDRYL